MSFRKPSSRDEPRNLRSQASRRPRFSYYSGISDRTRSEKADAAIDLSSSRSRWRWLPTILAVTVMIGCILYSLTVAPHPSVESFNEGPSPYRPLEEYGAAAEQIMRGNAGSLSKLTINTKDVERQLLERFPELKAAAIRLPVLGRKPHLVVDIEPPAILLATPSKSFILDQTGTVISEVSSLDEEARAGLVVVQDQSGLSISIGKHAIPSHTVSFITAVIAHLEANNLTASELTLPKSANQLDIHIQELPYYVKTDVAGDARLQIGSFLAVKESLAGEGITPAEYIDVRVEEKVFYK